MPQLAAKSLTVSRPILFHYTADQRAYRAMASSAFKAFSEGFLKADGVREIPINNASQAHELLEERTGGGALILMP